MGDLDGLRSLEALPADAGLTERVWRFGVLGEHPYATHVRLLPDGRVAGRLGGNEHRWAVDDEGRLAFLDGADRLSTVFGRAFVDDDGRLALVGYFQAPGGAEHLLREVAAPSALASPQGAPEIRWDAGGPRRRNLIALRANERSLHPRWPRDILERDRSWDLLVSWYGRAEFFGSDDGADGRVLQNRQFKYGAMHDLLHGGSALWSYDRIAFPDDDLMLSWGDWNALFASCRDHRLDLAQPALSHAGHIAHPITGRDPRYLLRYVSFVEGMTPIFSREALRLCAPTFKGAVSGFGLDNIWPKLLGEPRDRIAIIDQVAVVHTRAPQGGGTGSIEDAIQEGNALQHAYDAPSHVLEYGGILAEPINRQHAW